MTSRTYYAPEGGLPAQSEMLTGQAVFKDAYAVLPAGTMRDITTSFLPFWDNTRLWVIARPMSGFSETFSHYIMEVGPEGGSDRPELNVEAQGAIFVVDGQVAITCSGQTHTLTAGGFAYVPAGAEWGLRNLSDTKATFHWIRKAYEAVDGLEYPEFYVTSDHDVTPNAMPDTNGAWATSRFMDPNDMRFDMHITIVTFEPGGVIPFMETHVMEHGLYVLEGKAAYKLNQDWVEVEAGDYMWLRAFCPQACYTGGPGRFRYLLYKDVNRHMKLPF
ncbi:bifunctional allantoicase/(S)-ureidoglycine aminohydrolase [Cochlodiniinecator piscidefendens]|uniref:bifunctional allantoicase/(S)-ureidoglycine aminohydrolase n=1 Tax=Cochlodiniinecator piscidefendens TaxID=2715756 RepID=UPI00140752DB|nr:bifunctional allantoicase/(S)-ureidoglycine aminohydrolase [Cochlodiniinecator piscidefendens]